jgi:hypothetical protein
MGQARRKPPDVEAIRPSGGFAGLSGEGAKFSEVCDLLFELY